VRIVYLNTNPRNMITDPTGYATHMAKTIKGFEASGHEVVRLLASEMQGAVEARTAYRSLRVHIPEGLAKLVRDMYEILHDRRFTRGHASIVASNSPDFLYERANAFHVSGLRLSRKAGVPLVLEVNDPLRESVSMHLSALKVIAFRREDHLVRHADLVVVGSEALRRYFVDRGFPAEKVIVVYPAADEEIFSPLVDGAGIRRKYALENAVVIGFVGSMAPWHRVDLLLSALERVILERGNVKGLLVGDIRAETPIHGVGSLSVPGRIVFTGKIPYADVPAHIAAMDICVISNATWYGSPTKLFEYGRMGKAVIAPRFPPIQEVLEDGRSGLLFSPGSEIELRQSMESLAIDPGRRNDLGKCLGNLVTERFSWAASTRRVIDRIRQADVGRGRK
jgi:glycosyltransferase involved in cell wall biosynthesis